jgi:hypothetical protein
MPQTYCRASMVTTPSGVQSCRRPSAVVTKAADGPVIVTVFMVCVALFAPVSRPSGGKADRWKKGAPDGRNSTVGTAVRPRRLNRLDELLRQIHFPCRDRAVQSGSLLHPKAFCSCRPTLRDTSVRPYHVVFFEPAPLTSPDLVCAALRFMKGHWAWHVCMPGRPSFHYIDRLNTARLVSSVPLCHQVQARRELAPDSIRNRAVAILPSVRCLSPPCHVGDLAFAFVPPPG